MNMQVAAWGLTGPRVVAALGKKPRHLERAGNEGSLQGSLRQHEDLLPEQVYQAGALVPQTTPSHSDSRLSCYSRSHFYLH